MKYEIVPIDKLLPLELVFPSHLYNLEKMIDGDGFMLKAIIIDKKTGTILDGSHRYIYLLKNGYKEAPVYWSDYDDENVRVGTILRHRFLINNGTGISKEECRQRALAGNLFPPRTTRHFFPFRKNDISLPLSDLKRGTPVDVSHLIAKVEIFEEIAHNKKYIKEINEEVETIIQYLEEVSQTKRYLMKQIENMDKERQVAFFPGKFHPPHIGHIQTIMNILPKYRKIIIGVSEDMPTDKVVTNPAEVVELLLSFFDSFENVEVCLVTGVLSVKEDTAGLPEFDILLSGNEEVLSWAKRVGVTAKHIPRSPGNLFRGTDIRKEL